MSEIDYKTQIKQAEILNKKAASQAAQTPFIDLKWWDNPDNLINAKNTCEDIISTEYIHEHEGYANIARDYLNILKEFEIRSKRLALLESVLEAAERHLMLCPIAADKALNEAIAAARKEEG